jgi:membrane-anchored protein YejM (alkaline phosphatase superfamily)
VDAVIAWYFFYHSYLLSIPLLKYLKISNGPTKRLGRIAFSLVMNSAFMVASMVVHLMLAFQCVYGIRSQEKFYLIMFCFGTVRAGVAYWNVRIVLLMFNDASYFFVFPGSGGFYTERGEM